MSGCKSVNKTVYRVYKRFRWYKKILEVKSYFDWHFFAKNNWWKNVVYWWGWRWTITGVPECKWDMETGPYQLLANKITLFSSWGADYTHQILADQLSLFQSGGSGRLFWKHCSIRTEKLHRKRLIFFCNTQRALFNGLC